LVHNTLIHKARNLIAENAIKEKSDYVLWIDSDMVLPNGALEQLVAHDKDIVSGMYFQKKPHFGPILYKGNKKGTYDQWIDYPENQLVEVDGTGFGICLIKTSVFKKMGKDWFDPYPKTRKNPVINGEDLAFCKRAKLAGFKIFVDTSLQAAHQTVSYVTEEHFKKERALIEKYEKENQK
jgi:GT2 family glycosyltransferase